jgi:uncharacterized protein DUF4124
VFRGALRLLLAAALCAAPALARADVYRWVDGDGATHYATSRSEVPSAYRDAAQVIVPVPVGIPNPSSARPPEPPLVPVPTAVEPPAPAQPAPDPAPAAAPAPAVVPAQESALPPIEAAPEAARSEAALPAPEAAPAPAVAPPVAPPAVRSPLSAGDPRQQEIAELEAAIERDREELRNLISTPRWDASELASDAHVREIAERLPRLQAELAALRSEAER